MLRGGTKRNKMLSENALTDVFVAAKEASCPNCNAPMVYENKVYTCIYWSVGCGGRRYADGAPFKNKHYDSAIAKYTHWARTWLLGYWPTVIGKRHLFRRVTIQVSDE
jgi:hypothetical protein